MDLVAGDLPTVLSAQKVHAIAHIDIHHATIFRSPHAPGISAHRGRIAVVLVETEVTDGVVMV